MDPEGGGDVRTGGSFFDSSSRFIDIFDEGGLRVQLKTCIFSIISGVLWINANIDVFLVCQL